MRRVNLSGRFNQLTNKLAIAARNTNFETQSLIILATLAIMSTQLVIYFCYKSSPLWCNGIDLRFAKLQAQSEYLPTIYIITPTYDRFVQKAELTRLAHTFLIVPNVHWIIVEDSESNTELVSKFIYRLKNEFEFHTVTHLHEPTPSRYKLREGDPNWLKPRGVWQRNTGLQWIRDNLNGNNLIDHEGVIYFADDDNTYDVQLFDEMRYTKKVSIWPVGLVGGLAVERPIVRSFGGYPKVTSFNSQWKPDRPYPIDMAGFAVSVRLFASNLNASFTPNGPRGYQESFFLSQLIKSWDELEPKADKCTRVYVWHTRSERPSLSEERKLRVPSHEGLVL